MRRGSMRGEGAVGALIGGFFLLAWLVGVGLVITFWALVIYALYLLVTGQLHIG